MPQVNAALMVVAENGQRPPWKNTYCGWSMSEKVEQRQTLTQADVERLLKDPSTEARVDTAAKVASDFGTGLLSNEERRIAEDIFSVMVQDTEVRVREALSAKLHSSEHLSRDIAKSLAQDVESVALPVIQFSTVLTDDDLIDIVKTDNTEKQKAVARREIVSAPVSTALVDTSKEDVVSTLVSNDGADITEESLDKVVTEFGDCASVNEPLVMRKKLPIPVAERLVNLVSERLQEHLITHHELPPETVSDVIMNAREKATLDLLDPDSDGRDVRELVSQLYHQERLTPTIILRSLCLGDITFFEVSVAILARISLVNAQRLIHDKGELGLTAVLKQAMLPEPMFPAFVAAVEVSHETHYDGEENDRERFKRRMIERILTNFDNPKEGFGTSNAEYLLGKLAEIDPEVMAYA